MPDRKKVINDLRSIKTYLASRAIESTDDFAREGFIESQNNINDAIALIDTQYKLILELQNLISIGTKMMNGGKVDG